MFVVGGSSGGFQMTLKQSKHILPFTLTADLGFICDNHS